jgi:phosphate-selective porin OprO/OprP
MNFNKKLAVAVSSAVLLMAGQVALADSTSDIVDALVGKGILTEEEGKLISKGHESKTKVTPVVKEKDGSFSLESANGRNSIGLTGRMHLDYRHINIPGLADNTIANYGDKDTASGADQFELRRARIGVKGKLAKHFNYEAVVSIPGTATVDVAYMDFAKYDQVQFRFGKFKQPFGLEQLTSSRFIDFTERDWVSTMAPAVNKGIMIHGVPTTGVTYALSVSNGGLLADAGSGTTRETSNSADGKALNGRLTLNFAELAGNKEAIGHVGGWFGWDENLPTLASGGLSFRTNGRGTQFFTNNAATTFTNPEIKRGGVEGIAAMGPVKIQGEYAMLNMQQSGTIAFNDREITSGYIGVSYMLTGEHYASAYKNGLMDRMSPKNNYIGLNSSGIGAWEIGARYSKFDGSDWSNAISSTASTDKADSYTVGIKWIPEPNTRFLLDYIYTDFNKSIYGSTSSTAYTSSNYNQAFSSEKSLNFRAQFDF